MNRQSGLALFLSCTSVLAAAVDVHAQTAADRFGGTRWTLAGPNNAAKAPPAPFLGTYGPGAFNWSILDAGTPLYTPAGAEPAFVDTHLGASLHFDTLYPKMPGVAQMIVARCIEIWTTKSVTVEMPGSGVNSLGNVADPGAAVAVGRPNAAADVADMRIGVFREPAPVPQGTMMMEVLAHAFFPDTFRQKLRPEHNIYAAIGGDIHIRPNMFQLANPGMPYDPIGNPTVLTYLDGVDWYVDELAPTAPTLMPGPGQVDLFTVILHEVGHALGLGHDNLGRDGASVMTPIYLMPIRDISATDEASIKQLYIPSPGACIVLALGGLAAGRRRR